MTQDLIVAAIVVAAALYVARKYLPAGWRTKLVYFFTARGASQVKMARLLGTGASCASGCDTCKACAQPEPKPNERVIKIVRR